MLMQERDLVALPLKRSTNANPRQPAALVTLQVLRRFNFEPALMRSGIIAAEHEAAAGTALLFVKGAPSKLKPLLKGNTLPDDFQQVTKYSCMHILLTRRAPVKLLCCEVRYGVPLTISAPPVGQRLLAACLFACLLSCVFKRLLDVFKFGSESCCRDCATAVPHSYAVTWCLSLAWANYPIAAIRPMIDWHSCCQRMLA